ncbi:glycosyltransferase family 2 protein [Limosilactobacillus fermentum]|uniref:glycosyltransferase n=1 Tax=Limosilactobacillus fermentum TaxID=1613 RepID=UPI001107BE47|nr:glycosyltransferase family 2 protein [Limosilactobacillus fermentum]TLQ38362.1 glycosyltransferase family 2 protein [Limosilactobacillus fermentum]
MKEFNINLITLNYNDADTTINFVKRILNYKIINHIVVVDNQSTDDSFKKLKEIINNKVVLLSSGANKGYGYGNNFGIRYVNKHFDSDFIVIANPDVTFKEETLNSICDILAQNERAVMASTVMADAYGNKQTNTAWRSLSPLTFTLNEGAFIHRVFKLNQYSNLFNSNLNVRKVDCLAGSFFVLKKDKLFEKGIYDEKMFLYCEEDYLGLRLKQEGRSALLILNDSFMHTHGQTINKAYSKTKQDKLIFKNEIYLLQNYMNASRLTVNFAKAFFNFCIVERFLFRTIRQIIKGA